MLLVISFNKLFFSSSLKLGNTFSKLTFTIFFLDLTTIKKNRLFSFLKNMVIAQLNIATIIKTSSL